MRRFEICLHPRPAGVSRGEPIRLDGVEVARLDFAVEGNVAALAVFDVSFEQAADRLERLPRMFIEPDGAFVWTGECVDDSRTTSAKPIPLVEASPSGSSIAPALDSPARWQVDGVIYDRAGRVCHVELKGMCPEDRFDELAAVFGWPDSPLIVQLVRHGVFLDEADFRRWAWGHTVKEHGG